MASKGEPITEQGLAEIRARDQGLTDDWLSQPTEDRRKLLAEVDRLKAERDALLALDTPWPLHEVLSRLVLAADHLADDHACDAHGYEGLYEAVAAARRFLVKLPGVAPSAATVKDITPQYPGSE